MITLLVLGVAGQVESLARSVVVTVAPLLLGMLLGTFDPGAQDLFAPVVRGIVPLSMFAVGSRINLGTALGAGFSGFVLAGLVLVTGCLVGIWADRRTGGQGIAGATLGTTAGNAVLTPAAVAAFVPAASPLVAAASAQIATACVVTSLVMPVIISRLQK
ncbi:MAG: 2-keto-3-deoxygluconate permease [Chitinophagales bacterium]